MARKNSLYKPQIHECYRAKKPQNTQPSLKGNFPFRHNQTETLAQNVAYFSSSFRSFLTVVLCFLPATGSRTGGCLPLYSNSGSRGPDRQEGPAHQTTRPLRRSFHQGAFAHVDNALRLSKREERGNRNNVNLLGSIYKYVL